MLVYLVAKTSSSLAVISWSIVFCEVLEYITQYTSIGLNNQKRELIFWFTNALPMPRMTNFLLLHDDVERYRYKERDSYTEYCTALYILDRLLYSR